MHRTGGLPNMLQRSKSAGKQAARQMGYVPLPATQEGAGGAGSMQKLSRNVSPAPDQASKRAPAVKRTIAPGQVCPWEKPANHAWCNVTRMAR